MLLLAGQAVGLRRFSAEPANIEASSGHRLRRSTGLSEGLAEGVAPGMDSDEKQPSPEVVGFRA